MQKIGVPVFLGRIPRSVFSCHPHDSDGRYIIREDNDRICCQLIAPRDLTATDERIYEAICGLHDASISITPRAIYHAGGGHGSTSSHETKQILASVTTMMQSELIIDHQPIPLLAGTVAPSASQTGSVVSPNEIVLSEKPGLYVYVADGDRRLTTVSSTDLILPGMRRTNTVLAAQTLLIRRIHTAQKRGTPEIVIRFDSLFRELGFNSDATKHVAHRTATKQRCVARMTLLNIIDLYKVNKNIQCYNLYPNSKCSIQIATGIKIILNTQKT